MDKFFSISKAAHELGIHGDDLFDLASDRVITLTWHPSDFIHLYTIDMSTGEPKYFNAANPYPYDQPIDTIREGYFEIDLALCPSWKVSLNDIKLGGKGYGFTFGPIDPLAVKEVKSDGYIWSVTPPPELDTGRELDLPAIHTLGVFKKELERYKAQLKYVESRPKPDGVEKQREKAYKKYLDETNQWSRLSEEIVIGKNGFKNEVYEALKNEKSLNGNPLFEDKEDMKESWGKLKKTYNQKLSKG